MTNSDNKRGYHESHDEEDTQGEEAAQGRVPGRRGLTAGSEGSGHLRKREGDVPNTVNGDGLQPPEDAQHDEPSASAIIQAQLNLLLQEHHVHLPVQMPDTGWLEHARTALPEVYETYVQGLKDSIKTDNIVRREEARAPRRITTNGQITALIALVIVLVFAGYLAFLGHAVTAGIIAALDLVGIITAFASQRPGLSSTPPQQSGEHEVPSDGER